MDVILHIETATKNCSVSLGKDGELIDTIELAEAGFNHAEKLHVFIDEILQRNAFSYQSLNAIAVSKGPGSYTGLRIGVSAAKGLCYALDIPLIAINTLEALSRQLNVTEGVIVPMIDARRMEVFAAVYNFEFKEMVSTHALIVDESTMHKFDGLVHLIGDGAKKVKEVFVEDRFIWHENIIYPSSKQLVDAAFKKYVANDFEDVAYFEPYYLKDFMLTK